MSSESIKEKFAKLRPQTDTEIAYEIAVKEFGEDKVVLYDESKITIDTICFIGNLYVEKVLPTYNLRYIFGNLNYQIEEVINLENLEYVYGDFIFSNPIISISNLDNLDMKYTILVIKEVEKIVRCEIPNCIISIFLKDCIPEGLIIPKNVESINFFLDADNDYDATNLNLPETIKKTYFFRKFPTNLKLPNSLEEFRVDSSVDKDAKGIIVPGNVKVIDLRKCLDNLVLLDNYPNLTLSNGLERQIEYNNSKEKRVKF